MRIGIIGGGFTGLAAGYRLSKLGNSVHIYEKDSEPGGLAIGYKEPEWDWTFEKHYHHWFANDASVLSLAEETGFSVLKRRPQTSVYIPNIIYQLDSPQSVLLFSRLPVIDRLRMAVTLGLLKFNPFWMPLERVNTTSVLPRLMGSRAYKMIWEPQLIHKFGSFASDISLAWFWARVTKRTPSLVYPQGGFLRFAKHLVSEIEKQGGVVTFNTETTRIERKKNLMVSVKQKSGRIENTEFDKVIVTLPSFMFQKITPQLPEDYVQSLNKLKGIGAINLVLRLKKPFFPDKTYWLSVCDPKAPITAVVEHTNFMDKKYYNNEHLVYVGNYLPPDHPFFTLSKDQLLMEYAPFLKKINPTYEENLIGTEVFKAPFAQPIIPINYSCLIPPFETPLNGVYLANIEQVYPWDRGTNYAVELGEKITDIVLHA